MHFLGGIFYSFWRRLHVKADKAAPSPAPDPQHNDLYSADQGRCLEKINLSNNVFPPKLKMPNIKF